MWSIWDLPRWRRKLKIAKINLMKKLFINKERVHPNGHLSPDILDKHRDNLKKLADYLMTLRPGPAQEDGTEFNMTRWISRPGARANREFASAIILSEDINGEYPCGTAACAVGHGPRAGIPIEGHKNWELYCRDKFVMSVFSEEFAFMFSGDHINCPHAAARRINYLLENGLPTFYNQTSSYHHLRILEVGE